MTNIWEQKSHFYSLLQQSDPFYLAPARGPCTCIQLFLVLNGQCHHQDKSQPKCYTTRNIYSSPEGAEVLQACLLLDRMVGCIGCRCRKACTDPCLPCDQLCFAEFQQLSLPALPSLSANVLPFPNKDCRAWAVQPALVLPGCVSACCHTLPVPHLQACYCPQTATFSQV